jgi:hypothetical protein
LAWSEGCYLKGEHAFAFQGEIVKGRLIKSLLGIVVAGGAFYCVVLRQADPSNRSGEITESPSTKKVVFSSQQKNASPPSVSSISPAGAESPRCRQLLSKVEKMKFALPEHGMRPDGTIAVAAGQPSPLRDLMLGLTNGSCEYFPDEHPMRNAQDRVRQACQLRGVPRGDISYPLSMTPQCYAALEEFRAEANDYLTRGIPLDQISDSDVLSTKAEIYISRNAHFDPGYYAAVNERILELDPNNITAGKNAMRGRYLDWLSGGEGTPDPDKEEHLEKTLSAWEANHPGDTIVQEIKMDRARMKGDLDSMRKLAMETQESGASPDEGTYYLAWAAYLGNDKATAKQYLSVLVQKDPTNTRAQHALTELTAPVPAEPVHVFSDLVTTMPGN